MSELECLVIMPFDRSFDDVFATVKHAVESAVPGQTIHCTWLKDIQAAGRITDDIVNGIERAGFCISDLTGSNPNVMWETGYAMASRKPTILISQAVATLPFDLLIHRVHEYDPAALTDLAPNLPQAVRDTLSRYGVVPEWHLIGVSVRLHLVCSGVAASA